MKIKRSIGEKLRKVTKPTRNGGVSKGTTKHVNDEKNRDRLIRCLSQIRSAVTGSTIKQASTVNNTPAALEHDTGHLYQQRKSKTKETTQTEMKPNNVEAKPQSRGMKDIFKSLKNLRSRSNIKGCSYRRLPRMPQEQQGLELAAPYTTPADNINTEQIRRMPQRRLFSRAISNLDNSILSAQQYTMSTMMCPDTTIYSHPQPVFIESDADISLPRLSSTPLTARIGSPRFASTPTSDKHASIISRIDHVMDSSANQCSKIFETGHSVNLKMNLEPLFVESYEAVANMWRPWL
ncbi:uncharacterized protein LOC133205116 [Saccostrea echinata]|uniref:uncharacterized protein LOC133205116 n=1 Tax=Saccostrea echinata TaxID=191078 RepID=UPI002A7FA266|nr:uncharacterized protein LOC133205116 [Saccostrea echinata]